MDDKSFRSLLELDRLRVQTSMAGSLSGHRLKRKHPLQRERFEEDSSCKRFASEEEVTSHLKQLNLANCIAAESYQNNSSYPPEFYDRTPQNKLSPLQLTGLPLSVTTIGSCPGLLHGDNVAGGHMKGNLDHVTTKETCAERLINAPSGYMAGKGQKYTSEWVGDQNTLDVGQLVLSSSPLRLIDDTSTSHSDNWNSMGRDDMCPPLCSVRPEPDTEPPNPEMCLDSDVQYPNPDQFNYVPVSSNVRIRVMPPQLPNRIEDDTNTLNNTMISNAKTSDEVASSSLHCGESGQLSLLLDSQWRRRQAEVVIDDISSDSSDGKVDSPERPLSVWISPEFLDYSNSFQQKEYPLPQTLLEQYKSSVGMELIPWVDPESILLSGGEVVKDSNEAEMDV